MEEKNTKESSLGTDIADGIFKISDAKIELAFKERDVQFQQAIENTKNEAIKIASKVIKEEVGSVKKDMFVTFGIFTSFIAFIVGEINFFKNIKSVYDIVGFSFILCALMFGFLFGVIFIIDEKENKSKIIKMIYVFALFFELGSLFIVLGKIDLVLTTQSVIELILG